MPDLTAPSFYLRVSWRWLSGLVERSTNEKMAEFRGFFLGTVITPLGRAGWVDARGRLLRHIDIVGGVESSRRRDGVGFRTRTLSIASGDVGQSRSRRSPQTFAKLGDSGPK